MARDRLGWRPALDLDEALRYTVEWYTAYRDGSDMGAVTLRQTEDFLALAPAQKMGRATQQAAHS